MFKSQRLCTEKQNGIANFSLNTLQHKETFILEYSSWPQKQKFTGWGVLLRVRTQFLFKLYNPMDWLHCVFNRKPWDHRSSGDLKMTIFSCWRINSKLYSNKLHVSFGRKRNICKSLQRSKRFANTLEVTKWSGSEYQRRLLLTKGVASTL